MADAKGWTVSGRRIATRHRLGIGTIVADLARLARGLLLSAAAE